MVLFIHRPEYYRIYSDDKGRDLRGKAEIIIAKHRNGAVGDVLLTFKGQYARFQNPDDENVVPMPGEETGMITQEPAADVPPISGEQLPPPDAIPFAPPSGGAPF